MSGPFQSSGTIPKLSDHDALDCPVMPFPAQNKPSDDPKKGLPLHDVVNLPTRPYKLPESVYGGVLVAHILQDISTWGQFWTIRVETWLRLLINNFIQVVLIYTLAQIGIWQADILDIGEECYALNIVVFLVCMWVYQMNVLMEVVRSVDMIDFLVTRVELVPGRSQTLKFAKDDNALAIVGGGMSTCLKTWLILLVALPRLSFALLMVVFGGRLLHSSTSNSDLFMNTLAANFVLEVDELIYAFLTPDRKKLLLAEMPVFEYQPTQLYAAVHHFWFSFKLIGSIVVVMITYMTAPGCPNDPCHGAIRDCPLLGLAWYMDRS